MKVVQGDLIQLALEGHFDVIIHGCNCFCTMGKGIAKTIKQFFPEAYEIDKETSKGNASKLGTFTYVEVEKPKGKITIVNAYTQYHYNPNFENSKLQLDYRALERVMKRISIVFRGLRIGYPKIGAGLAGGNWDKISEIIDRELKDEDHTLVEFV